MLQLHKLRSVEGSAIISFALGAPLVLALTLAVINVAGVLWSREVAHNLLNRMVVEGSRDGSDLSAISHRWQTAIAQSHLDATPIHWSFHNVGESTRILIGQTQVQLLTIGLPLEQSSGLEVHVVME